MMIMIYLIISAFFAGYTYLRSNNLLTSCLLGLVWPISIITIVYYFLAESTNDANVYKIDSKAPSKSIHDYNNELCSYYRSVVRFCLEKRSQDQDDWWLIFLDVFKSYTLTKNNPNDVPLTVVSLVNIMNAFDQLSKYSENADIRHECSILLNDGITTTQPILDGIRSVYGRKINGEEKQKAIEKFDAFVLGEHYLQDLETSVQN